MKALIKSLFLPLFVAVSTLATAQIDTAFVYRITNAWQGEGKSLSVGPNENKVDIPLLKSTSDDPTQHWRIAKNKYGNFILTNVRLGSAKRLECLAGDINNKLVLGDKKNVASQNWNITKNSDGSYRITSLWQGTGKALDVINDGTNNQLQMANTGNFSGQMWKFTKLYKVEPPKPAVATATNIFNDSSASYRLTTVWQGEGKSLSLKDGRLSLQQTADESGQYWKLVMERGGFYRFINRQQKNKSLDVVNDGKANNQLTLANTGAFSGQFWKIIPLGNDAYRLTTQWQGDSKSLDIVNDGKSNNQIILNATGSYSGQMWKITKVSMPTVQSIKEGLSGVPQPPVGAIVGVPAPTPNEVQYEINAGQGLTINKRYYSQDKRYWLVFQDDSNLVLYNADGSPRWATGTNERKATKAVMQTDGNLVLYNEDEDAVWASDTHGNPGAFLLVSDDGDLMILTRQFKRLWHSDTSDGGK